MHPSLKQRLIGALVLVALAVIFLPMLLPGNDGSTMPMFGSNVPDAPNTKFEPIEIPLQLPPAAPDKEVSVVDQPQPGDVASKEKPQLPVEPKPAVTTPAAPPAEKPAVTSTENKATPPQITHTPAPSPAPASSGEWDVQLGSFSSSVNALTLQDKVRKAGFRGYVEKVKSGSSTIYRVRVGPESSRERADALLERVRAKLRMKGIVVPHKS